jgi:hypothetical protein
MSRTYTQIRSKALEVLKNGHNRGEFGGLLEAVATAYAKEEAHKPHQTPRYGTFMELSEAEKTLLLEVFWDLFREGVITLGIDEANPGYPYFHLSERGRKRLETAQ